MILPLVGIVVLALLGMPLFCTLAAIGLFGLHNGDVPISNVITDVYSFAGDKADTISTIPMFCFMGYLMAASKTAQRLIRAAEAMVGWIPGGLAVMTVWVCAFFTTFTGASGVTIVAVGGLILPALEKARYPKRLALGVVSGSGSVGLLFPPALPLIVYGIVFGIAASARRTAENPIEFDIDRFLFAGVVPGLLLVVLLSIYCIGAGIYYKTPRARFHLWKLLAFPLCPPIGIIWGLIVDKEFRRAVWSLLPELLVPVVVLGPLMSGLASLFESAALCALYVFAIEVFLYKDIKIGRQLLNISRESMTLVGAIFMKIVGATILYAYFVDAQIPDELFKWLGNHFHSTWSFLLMMNLVLLVVGCLMDIFSAIVVIAPLLVPAVTTYHIDPYHLGVIFLLNLEIGYLLPPAGLNLFIAAFRFRRPITELYRAVVPFILIMFLTLMVVTYVPKLTVVPPAPERAPAADVVPAPAPPVAP